MSDEFKKDEKSISVSDAARYRRLSEPVVMGTVDARIEGFWKDIGEAREKHGIADVYAILRMTVTTEDGEEGAIQTACHWGDDKLSEGMASWALGREQVKRQNRNAALLGMSGRVTDGRSKK